MRVFLIGLLGLLVFWLLWPLSQLLVGLDPDGNPSFPLLRWLAAGFLVMIATGFITAQVWRWMSR